MAHEATHWARANRIGDEFHTGVFEAFYGRGENIGEIGVLTQIAKDLNADSDTLVAALKNGEYLESVLADQTEAGDLGVSSVPTFIADRSTALSGVQSAENLQRLIDHVRQ